MGFFGWVGDMVKKYPEYESEILYGCGMAKTVENIKSLYAGGPFKKIDGVLTNEVSGLGNVMLTFKWQKFSTEYLYTVLQVNENVSKIRVKVKDPKYNHAKTTFDNIKNYLNKMDGVKPVSEADLKGQPAKPVKSEDFGGLSLDGLVDKFNEKLDGFESDMSYASFSPLIALRDAMKNAINKLDGKKKTEASGAFSSIDMYVNTLKTQLQGPTASMVSSFAGTYVGQMRNSLTTIKSVLAD